VGGQKAQQGGGRTTDDGAGGDGGDPVERRKFRQGARSVKRNRIATVNNSAEVFDRHVPDGGQIADEDMHDTVHVGAADRRCAVGVEASWRSDCLLVPFNRCRVALSILAAALAAAASSSVGVPEPGMMPTGGCVNRSGGVSMTPTGSSSRMACP